MEYQWIQIEDDTLIIGINEEAIENLEGVRQVLLPGIDDTVGSKRSFGEIKGLDEILSLYSPFEGVVLESNQLVIDSPNIVNEDPMGDGWLLKLRVTSEEEVSEENIRKIEDEIDQ